MINTNFSKLKAGVAPLAVGFALLSAPAFAQDNEADNCVVAPDSAECADTADSNVIVVTGSILRTNVEDASPVTVIDADKLETRGITTVEEAIQNISANGAGALPNSFTANGAFAAGASAASLRGLTTSSTLVLFDGLRAAYYPLADDGTRNFVDLNTIPDATVDRVEILKDGASSTYGADAIAGVVNVITKKEIQGLHLGGEYGIAEKGFGEQYNLTATYGVGDLADQGFNFYISGRYFNQDIVYNRDLDAPYNSGRGLVCNDDATDCLDNTNGLYLLGREVNGDFSGLLYTSLLDRILVAPYSVTGAGTAGGRTDFYQQLNPNLPCRNGVTELTPTEASSNVLASNRVCTYDLNGQFGVVQPNSQRINGTMRATFQINDDIQGYAQFNYARSDVDYDFYDASIIRASAPAETGITYNISPLFLPVYICPGATYDAAGNPENNGCNAANGTLNPNNPFAASGQSARVIGALNDIQESSRYKTDSFRFATGVSGSIGNDWYFDVNATAMKVTLDRTLKGRIYIANFLQAVADGSYNFVNPSANSDDIRNFIAPTVYNKSTSELYQIQGVVSRDLFELPGGPLQIGLGASWRDERVNAPGADGDGTLDPNLVDKFQRYTSRVNPFGSKGQRTVWSVFGEAKAPVTDFLDVNFSGRYDDYSSGQSNFSPKVGVEFHPIREILLRGTWSKGFRIGSFAEFGASPTTGYVSPATATISDAVQAQYAAANGGTLPPYITSYALGLTTQGNPNLKPEKSESYTLGLVAEPIRGVSFTVDYYHIKKTDLITGADYQPALDAYYAGQPIPAGFAVIPNDPAVGAQYAGLIPTAQFVTYSFTNKDSGVAEGIDFAASASFPLFGDVRFTSSAEASYLIELSQTVDGQKQEFQGSLGPYVITAGTGSPQWRGSWQNTLDFGKAYASLTAYYTSSYKTTAEDITGPGTKDDCANTLSAHYYVSGDPYQCKVKSFTYFNMSLGYDITEGMRVYANINNVFNNTPPIDSATYGGYLYNSAFHGTNVFGRTFRIGAKLNF